MSFLIGEIIVTVEGEVFFFERDFNEMNVGYLRVLLLLDVKDCW